jgi:putative transposase
MIKISYSGDRFPPEIIQHAIWLYIRFTLSFRDVEDLLAERGIMVSYETVRRRVNHFGPMVAADLRKRRPKPHTTWHLDEVYLKIDGRMVYLWRAVDPESEVLDVLVQTSGSNLTFESLLGFPRFAACASLRDARRKIHHRFVGRSASA